MLCCFLVTATMFGVVFSVAFWCSFYSCLDLQEKYGIFCEIASLSAESGCGPFFSFLFTSPTTALDSLLLSRLRSRLRGLGWTYNDTHHLLPNIYYLYTKI
ncbi:hypothetical protein VPH35_138490 [Triticum aestivum]